MDLHPSTDVLAAKGLDTMVWRVVAVISTGTTWKCFGAGLADGVWKCAGHGYRCWKVRLHDTDGESWWRG